MHTPMLGGETRRVFLSGRHEVLPRPLRHHPSPNVVSWRLFFFFRRSFFQLVFTHFLILLCVGEGETYAATAGIMEFMHISYINDETHLEDFPKPMVINMDSTVAESFMKNSLI